MQISVGLQEESYWHIFQSNALENFHNFFFRLGVSENHNIFDHRNTSLASLFDVIWGCLGLMDWKHKRALFGGVNVRGRDSQSRFVDLNKNRIYKVCITSVSLSLCKQIPSLPLILELMFPPDLQTFNLTFKWNLHLRKAADMIRGSRLAHDEKPKRE